MGERKNPFRNLKFVVRPSTPLLKIVVILVILFSMAALVAMSWVRSSIAERTADMQAQAAELEYQNEELEEKVGKLGSVESVKDIAREELGLVDPDEVVVEPIS